MLLKCNLRVALFREMPNGNFENLYSTLEYGIETPVSIKKTEAQLKDSLAKLTKMLKDVIDQETKNLKVVPVYDTGRDLSDFEEPTA